MTDYYDEARELYLARLADKTHYTWTAGELRDTTELPKGDEL